MLSPPCRQTEERSDISRLHRASRGMRRTGTMESSSCTRTATASAEKRIHQRQPPVLFTLPSFLVTYFFLLSTLSSPSPAQAHSSTQQHPGSVEDSKTPRWQEIPLLGSLTPPPQPRDLAASWRKLSPPLHHHATGSLIRRHEAPALVQRAFAKHEEEEGRRRELAAFSWRFMGLNLNFNQGPSLASLNASFFRYDSVIPDPASVDWRSTPYVTPISVQYNCASCWAMAAADTVAMATAIAANRTAVPAATQQICDCSGHQCCSGGWPEDAFAYMVQSGNITANRDYNYWASDGRQCSVNNSMGIAGGITGWERVPAFSQEALMKAVNMQPVLVYISASSSDFQRYSSPSPGDPRGVSVYDGNCSNEVNHAMVVVGYHVALKYWILKNTWPADGWGDNGYMYIKMLDGSGKCGMLSVNPLFPVNFPSAPNPVTVHAVSDAPTLAYGTARWWEAWTALAGNDPCAGVINPCGNGTCFNDSGIARCLCPSPYVEVVGVPTSKCVHRSPCTVSLINPCGAGSCMDVGDGSYLCGCPQGYAIGSRVDGAPTCVPVNDVLARTYVAQYGDSCQRLQSLYTISSSTFSALNPYLDCSQPLVPGVVVTITNSSGVPCSQAYAMRPSDTCPLLAYFLGTRKFSAWLAGSSDLSQVPQLLNKTPKKWSPASQDLTPLMALNPALNCTSLMTSQQVCVSAVSSPRSADPPTCGRSYTVEAGDTCNKVMRMFGIKNKAFDLLNPGFNCNSNPGGRINPGVQICIALSSDCDEVECSEFYTVQQGDTCAHIWNAANMSQYQFFYINPGLQCQTPYLYTGKQICISSPALVNISDPNYLTYNVQVNDTWATVQSHFSRQCKPWSISVPRIAQQNNIDSWLNYTLQVNTTLVIPCVPGIGATCGCAPSLPVCGADFVNYESFCDAQCNFALPTVSGACSSCQTACQGRMGQRPSPLSACTDNYFCPWPQWPPPMAYAQQIFSTSPQCSYRSQQCQSVCAMLVENLSLSSPTPCINSCSACQRVPCSGPSETVSSNSSFCPTCTSPGCVPSGKACATDCSYWNLAWNPLNP